MCNVIILLNKPLEEDIPFTTSSEAGAFKPLSLFVSLLRGCQNVHVVKSWMDDFLSEHFGFILLRVHCNLSFVISKTSSLVFGEKHCFAKMPSNTSWKQTTACFENSKFTSAAVFFFFFVCLINRITAWKNRKDVPTERRTTYEISIQNKMAAEGGVGGGE